MAVKGTIRICALFSAVLISTACSFSPQSAQENATAVIPVNNVNSIYLYEYMHQKGDRCIIARYSDKISISCKFAD